MNEKFCILIRIALKFIPKGPIDNKPALVQVMAWHGTGNKPLPELMLTQSTCTYIKGILPKGPYLPCVGMAGRALFAGYHRYVVLGEMS